MQIEYDATTSEYVPQITPTLLQPTLCVSWLLTNQIDAKIATKPHNDDESGRSIRAAVGLGWAIWDTRTPGSGLTG